MIPWFGAALSALLRTLLVACLSLLPVGVSAAESVLRLVGGDGRALDLSLQELQAMPQTTVATENEFSDGVVSYRGPLVRDVLGLAGMERLAEVRFVAANDYFVDIPTRDFSDYDAILAMTADGERLSRREKGPLWLMYPISDHAELRSRVYLRRLIWQVVRIESR